MRLPWRRQKPPECQHEEIAGIFSAYAHDAHTGTWTSMGTGTSIKRGGGFVTLTFYKSFYDGTIDRVEVVAFGESIDTVPVNPSVTSCGGSVTIIVPVTLV